MQTNSKNVTSLQDYCDSRSSGAAVRYDPRPALRTDWVERIFAVLAAGFGSQFADKWAGVDADEKKALWARKLAGFFDQPEAIREALDKAVELKYPPNLGEFYSLCQSRYQIRPAVRDLPKSFADLPAAKRKIADESLQEINALVRKMKMGGEA